MNTPIREQGTRIVALMSAVFLYTLALPLPLRASGGEADSPEAVFPGVFFFFTVLLLAASIGALAERVRQPAVLGELLMGVALGALALFPGFASIHALREHVAIEFIAFVGVILLLFRSGLESNLNEMRQVGVRAFMVAAVGVVVPFGLGYLVSWALLPEAGANAHLFIGATLTATSVGITARVFGDLGVQKLRDARIVLGAAVIDDVLGLLILAVVSGIVLHGAVSLAGVTLISGKAIGFLVGAIILGRLLAPRFGALFSRIHNGVGMKQNLALLLCAAGALGAAALAGLAPIVGAFAIGLVLDPVHFKAFSKPRVSALARRWAEAVRGDNAQIAAEMDAFAHREEDAHVERIIDRIQRIFVPVFFVYTGLQVDLRTFADPAVLGVALAITAVAVIGKAVSGAVAGGGVNRLLVGFGMVPRGEVGLIFANIGKGLGVVDDALFSALVIVVILTTLITPPILGALITRARSRTAQALA